MDLQGSIDKFTLADILQLIATGRKSGTLGIQRDDSIVMIYFESGDVIYAYGPRETFHLGELLTERGKITTTQLQTAITTQATINHAKRLGEILIDMKCIDRADLEAVVREQVEELLFSLLAWRTGSFKFYENEFPTREEITVNLSVENVILEGLRRLDEQAMIREALPDLSEVFRLTDSQSGRTRAVTLKADEWNVMALVDGHHTLEQVCEISQFKRHETLNRLAQLKLAGLIGPTDKKPLPTADNSNLEKMIGSLSRLLENYLTEKSGPPKTSINTAPASTLTTDRNVPQLIAEENFSESQ